MPKRILMVDDEADLIKVVHVRLAANGYKVIAASNGLDGLKKARDERPDLILLDVMMPRMHGLDVLLKLKDNPETASIPVLMLTANDDTESISKARALGAKDYIVKPFNLEALMDSVKRYLS